MYFGYDCILVCKRCMYTLLKHLSFETDIFFLQISNSSELILFIDILCAKYKNFRFDELSTQILET